MENLGQSACEICLWVEFLKLIDPIYYVIVFYNYMILKHLNVNQKTG